MKSKLLILAVIVSSFSQIKGYNAYKMPGLWNTENSKLPEPLEGTVSGVVFHVFGVKLGLFIPYN